MVARMVARRPQGRRRGRRRVRAAGPTRRPERKLRRPRPVDADRISSAGSTSSKASRLPSICSTNMPTSSSTISPATATSSSFPPQSRTRAASTMSTSSRPNIGARSSQRAATTCSTGSVRQIIENRASEGLVSIQHASFTPMRPVRSAFRVPSARLGLLPMSGSPDRRRFRLGAAPDRGAHDPEFVGEADRRWQSRSWRFSCA